MITSERNLNEAASIKRDVILEIRLFVTVAFQLEHCIASSSTASDGIEVLCEPVGMLNNHTQFDSLLWFPTVYLNIGVIVK